MSKPKQQLKSKKKPLSRMVKKKGKSPGAIIYVGHREGMRSTAGVVEYSADEYRELTDQPLQAISGKKEEGKTYWINVIGISDEAYIEKLGKEFGLNALVLEDAINTQQRPKIDEYEDYIFGVLKMLYRDENQQLVVEHAALTLFEDKVLVLQELKEDVFHGVRERIRNKSGRIRNRGADYLFFALIDAIVDSYLEVVEHIFERIEVLEDEVYYNPKPETARKIQELKKEVLRLHKWIFPVKELIHRLIETDNSLISKDTKLFLRDALDHCTEVNESLQVYREMSVSLMEMYMSNVSNKMNEVMKVLTIMASIFIPLTFIAGIYGMNFDRMPELHWDYGYFSILGLMFVILILMLIFFKRKGWL
jgi:magnesium transporter